MSYFAIMLEELFKPSGSARRVAYLAIGIQVEDCLDGARRLRDHAYSNNRNEIEADIRELCDKLAFLKTRYLENKAILGDET